MLLIFLGRTQCITVWRSFLHAQNGENESGQVGTPHQHKILKVTCELTKENGVNLLHDKMQTFFSVPFAWKKVVAAPQFRTICRLQFYISALILRCDSIAVRMVRACCRLSHSTASWGGEPNGFGSTGFVFKTLDLTESQAINFVENAVGRQATVQWSSRHSNKIAGSRPKVFGKFVSCFRENPQRKTRSLQALVESRCSRCKV